MIAAQRVLGCLFGVHCGDALGAAWEFQTPDFIERANPGGVRTLSAGGQFDWPEGAATDDTAQTLLVAEALLTSDPELDLSVTLVRWLRDGPPDVGTTTMRGLRNTERSGRAGTEGMYGNGSLMRTAPVGCVTSSPDIASNIARGLSSVTHSDSLCVDACGAYAAIVCELVNGRSVPDALATGVGVAANRQTSEAIRTGSHWPLNMQPPASGHVIDSLRVAVSALGEPVSAIEALSQVVLLGYDTDTNAAIAGGLIGARDGIDAWPDKWLDVLQRRSDVSLAAGRLAYVREHESAQRP